MTLGAFGREDLSTQFEGAETHSTYGRVREDGFASRESFFRIRGAAGRKHPERERREDLEATVKHKLKS